MDREEREILDDLRAYADRGLDANGWGGGWARPLDVGGSNSSAHSRLLAKLVRRELVERKPRQPWKSRRGSWLYRITPAGREALKPKENAHV